jgi:hypothetical protein
MRHTKSINLSISELLHAMEDKRAEDEAVSFARLP